MKNQNQEVLTTISLPYKCQDNEIIYKLLQQFSNVVRFSYNRFKDNNSQKQIRQKCKQLKNIQLLNSWIIQCGIKNSLYLFKRKDQKIIFGGKNNFLKRMKNKITNKQLKDKRLLPLSIQGQYLRKGNRNFKLDIIQNNNIIFKLNKTNHIKLHLPDLHKNIKNQLFKLEQLNNVKGKQKGYTYSIKLDLNKIYISFKPFKQQEIELFNQRYIGIDLNPQNIGISICQNQNVLYSIQFSLSKIINKITSQKLSSDSERMKYFQNKLKHQTIEISKQISKLAKKFNCKSVFIQDLNFKGKKSNFKKTNRKNKNLWKQLLFVNNLIKRLNVYNINVYKVNPAYTSVIGNLKYDYVDSINASIQIGRRGYNFHILKSTDKFYPILDVKHRWKEMVTSYSNWKEFYQFIKNSKMRYRVSLEQCKPFKVLQFNHNLKSRIIKYVFYN